MPARPNFACTRLVLLLTTLLLVAATAGPAPLGRTAVEHSARLVATEGQIRPATPELLVPQASGVRPASPPDADGPDAAGLAPDPDSPAPEAAEAAPPPPSDPPAPRVIPRTKWDPKGKCSRERGSRTAPSRIHLHHTHLPVVEVPGHVGRAMRKICASHGRRGFTDVGYHYAVDPFGRVWQGRGPLPENLHARVPEGAHAQGFNEGSIGVVLIGDFDLAPPTPEAMAATTELLAFLAGHFDLDPQATVGTKSTGGPSTRFSKGTHVHLPAIVGHRDTGKNTACPGEHLYALLPQLRQDVAARLAAH